MDLAKWCYKCTDGWDGVMYYRALFSTVLIRIKFNAINSLLCFWSAENVDF